MITAKQNMEVVQRLMRDWHLGPKVASVQPLANKQFWKELAGIWNVSEAEARRWFCANCEYFDNTPEMLAEMESIPLNSLDMDGGGRGWCHKFDFICHNLRVCQAWERKDYSSEDEMDTEGETDGND